MNSRRKKARLRFTTLRENRDKVLEICSQAGFAPSSLEDDGGECVILIFSELDNETISSLVKVIPPRYSALQGAVAGHLSSREL